MLAWLVTHGGLKHVMKEMRKSPVGHTYKNWQNMVVMSFIS
ncbi:hypothetical protein XBI1_1030005 [Xenorhabdus bovienii str. Intermedium]|uniref:Uncharacterized protein n=1 Tax=Xenorhabdus bovienii str. Intermedium TaxID=1379677 RepID=A0A077QET8_XENBV|nr:hypothetical protein XBI1_1030005 [Xenorhabdus bovienii str. Intermedium]